MAVPSPVTSSRNVPHQHPRRRAAQHIQPQSLISGMAPAPGPAFGCRPQLQTSARPAAMPWNATTPLPAVHVTPATVLLGARRGQRGARPSVGVPEEGREPRTAGVSREPRKPHDVRSCVAATFPPTTRKKSCFSTYFSAHGGGGLRARSASALPDDLSSRLAGLG